MFTVGVDKRLVPQALLVGALFGCLSAFVTGALTDRFGRRPVIVAVAAFLVVFPAPAFLLLDTGNPALVVALAREFSAVLGGGIAPLLSGVLVAVFAGWIGVVVYMTATMLVTLITAIRMPETRGRDLKLEADA